MLLKNLLDTRTRTKYGTNVVNQKFTLRSYVNFSLALRRLVSSISKSTLKPLTHPPTQLVINAGVGFQ